MNWQDIGGRTRSQHIVVVWNYGVNVTILCKHHIIKHTRTKDNRQLPHCQQCIDALKKLIEESKKTVQLELPSPKVEHRCGVQGFNPMLGDTCPACNAFYKKKK